MNKRPYETRYWVDARRTQPITRGFPKAQAGSVTGAAKAVASGMCNKVQCIDRENERVLWTVRRGARVPGVAIRPIEVVRGDDEAPGRRRA